MFHQLLICGLITLAAGGGGSSCPNDCDFRRSQGCRDCGSDYELGKLCTENCPSLCPQTSGTCNCPSGNLEVFIS